MLRELTLALKLADSSTLRAWARSQSDPALRAVMDRLKTKTGDNAGVLFANAGGQRHLVELTSRQAIGWYDLTLT